MNSKIFAFIAGALFGAAAFAGGNAFFPHPAKPAANTDAIKRAEIAIVDAKKREALLDAREKMLNDREKELADAAGPNADSGPAGLFGNANPKAAAAMAKVASSAIKQQMDMRMAAIKSRLQLTDDQAQALQAVMDKQAQMAQDMTEKMLSGKMSKDELQKSMQNGGGEEMDFDKALQGIVTPEQYAQYQAYQNDEKRSNAEAMANGELAQIQTSLQLTEDQKDKVFAEIYQESAQMLGIDGAKATLLTADQRAEAKKAAMQAILTPEQFATYSKMVDSQTQMQKQMMDAFGVGDDKAGAGANSTVDSSTSVTVSVGVGP